MFFNKKKQKHQRTVRFSDADSIVMESDGKHYELFPRTQTVKYRNVISPRDGHMSFPTGYFDEKVTAVPSASIEMISTAFDQLFLNRESEWSLDPLPSGASRDAYIRVSRSKETFYYTNTHTAEGGSSIKKEPVAAEYIQLIRLLEKHCSFPDYIPNGIPLIQSPELIARISKDIESDKCNEYIGYRFHATGVFGYKFFNAESDTVCSVSSVVAPSAPVTIISDTVTWESDFENCTIYPGLSRDVVDKSKDQQILQLVYKGTGKYTINESIEVYCDTDNFAFYRDDIIIAKTERINSNSEHLQIVSDAEYDYDPYYRITADNGIHRELLLVILSFPMLRFGL